MDTFIPITRAHQRRSPCLLTKTIPLTTWGFVPSMKTVAEHRCRASNSERSRCHFANFPEPKVFNRFSKQELWNETDKYSLHFYVLCLRTRVAGAVASTGPGAESD